MKISVVTAVYNCRQTVGEALESLLEQSHSDVEPIVIDGASTDGTLEVLERYRDRLPIIISEPDRGIYDALNKGICRASGDVVGFLHADDLLADRHALARVAAAFAQPGIDAVYGDLEYVDKADTSRIIRYWKAGAFDPASLPRGWMPPHPTFYLRRSLYQELGGFDTRYRIAADYDAMLRFLLSGRVRTAYIPQVQVRMRIGGISNRSLRSIGRKSREDYLIMRSHRIGGLSTLLRKNVGKLGQFWRP